jgi:type VII secretion integral membrane protein EccD
MSVSSRTRPRRVTVVAPETRMDLALPAEATVAELLPQLVRFAGVDEADAVAASGGWVLSRLGGSPFEEARSIAAAGVNDGETLYLTARSAKMPPVVFDDVIDAIADASHESEKRWIPVTTRRFGMATSAGALIAASPLLLSAPQLRYVPLLLAITTTVILVLASGALSRAAGDAPAGATLALAALPYGFFSGTLLIAATPRLSALDVWDLMLGFVAVLATSVLIAMVVGAHLSVYVTTAIASLIGALTTAGIVISQRPQAQVAGIAACIIVALLPAQPMLSLRLARLPLPRVPVDMDSFRRDDRPTLGPDVVRQTGEADAMLTGLITVTALTLGYCQVALAGSGQLRGVIFTAMLAIAQALRARHLKTRLQRGLLLTSALIGAISTTAAYCYAVGPLGRLILIPAGVLLAVILLWYSLRMADKDPSPYWGRFFDVCEFAALGAILPLAAWVLDIFAAARAVGG